MSEKEDKRIPLKEDHIGGNVIIPNKWNYDKSDSSYIRHSQEPIIKNIVRPDTGKSKGEK
ncbi:hypothetical protein [Caproiciproducens sp.]